MTEAVTAAPTINNDEIWEFLNRVSRPVGGGSDEDIWEGLGVADEERVSWGERFEGAVDGVRGFLQRIHLPKFRGEPAGAPEPDEAGRNRFFGWLGEQKRRFDEWRQSGGGEEGEEEGESEVPVMTEEGEADRFGWLKNGLEWLKGTPGGLINKFRREGAVGSTGISREERVKALKEGTGQFLKEWGPEIAVGLLGGYLGYSTVSIEGMVATGNFTPMVMEIGAALTAGFGAIGLSMGDEQSAETLSEVEGRFGRVARAIQRGCSNSAVRRGLKLLTAGSSGFAVGGIGRMVVETLQTIQQVAPAGAPATSEAGGSVSSSVGTVVSPDVAELHAEAIQHAIEAVQSTVNQSTADIIQANQTLSGISPDLLGDSSVSPLADSARRALETANRFYSDAMASGGIDASEAAKLKELASQAQQAVDAAKQTAQHVADSLAQAAQAAADTAAQQAAAAANAETVRQGVLQGGQIMTDVIASTPSQTAFEALQQQVFQATGSPYAVEAANALSWTLPKADITGLHTGAISEAAKTVVNLIGQAHDYTAGRGVEYTINSIRQAVDAGQLSADVLKAVEAANAPVGEVKAAAQTGLNTILQGIIK